MIKPVSIELASLKDARMLSELAAASFIESHGCSASINDINHYVNEKYNEAAFITELGNPSNIYHIIYCDEIAAGYSKIILNTPPSNLDMSNITKLERLYLLKEFYDRNLGLKLFDFNIELSKTEHQAGIWLYVWTANHRAIRFYEKNGFKITGEHDFKISETHSNPNHQMTLIYT